MMDTAQCQVTRRELRAIDKPWQRNTQSERARGYDKCVSTFDVTGLDLSELLVCCIWVTTWHPEDTRDRTSKHYEGKE